MIYLLELLLLYTGILTTKYFKLKRENIINHHNYINCLMVLQEMDPSLKQSIESEKIKI